MVVAMVGVGAVIRRETSSPRPSPGGPARRDSSARAVAASRPARGERDLQPAPFVAGAPRTVVAYAVASAWIPCSIAGSAAIP